MKDGRYDGVAFCRSWFGLEEFSDNVTKRPQTWSLKTQYAINKIKQEVMTVGRG